jgi:hypothetical protein
MILYMDIIIFYVGNYMDFKINTVFKNLIYIKLIDKWLYTNDIILNYKKFEFL